MERRKMMNIIKQFNQTVQYIETVLDDEVDTDKLFLLSGYSYPMFSRLFSILTGSTLSEYIRNRRLSQAAIDLRNSNVKIIDLAMKYGYETSDSFSLAFKKFHGVTPTDVRRGAPYRVVSQIQLALTIQGGRSMNIRIQNKEGFIVAGINRNEIDASLCPKIWEELYSNFEHEELANLGNGQSLGVCHDLQKADKINYMAGYAINKAEQAKSMGLDIIQINPAEYAVVELKGPVPECIHEGWKFIMEVFFPENGYKHSGQADFEYYFEGDMTSHDYQMELWVPIEKVTQS